MYQAIESKNVSHASGSYIYLENGAKVLDGISSWWVITHGHCHPLISEAIALQAKKLDQVVFANFVHDPAEQLVNTLNEFLPKQMTSAFFSDNGSTAVEAAMKMAYQFCQQTGQFTKRKFIAFANSYHGDTCGAMSVSADGAFTSAYSDLRLEVIRCRQGQFSFDEADIWINDFQQTLESRHHEVSAVIIEPLVQGAGGMIMWPISAVKKICSLCREYGVLVIFDEVMTGFGRTGSMFAFEQIDFVPDFLCLSKGITGGLLPLGLTLTTEQIYEAFLSKDSAKMFFHGHSFTGNALSCAAACANLEIFKSSDVLKNISNLKEAHAVGIKKLKQKVQVKDSRVTGAIGAVELNEVCEYGSHFSRSIFQRCLRRGLFIRPLGHVIYLMPPYCTEKSQVEWAWAVIADTILESSAELC